MEVPGSPAPVLAPSDVSVAPASGHPGRRVRWGRRADRRGVLVAPAPGHPGRLPESVYCRRRLAVVMIVGAALALVLALGRPERVPPGEANPWPSTGAPSLPAGLSGVYVVQPGDTLWDIALAVAPGDPRALVHDLAEAAGGAALEPGQQIVIGTSAIADSPDGASLSLGQQAAVDPEAERTGGNS